MNLKKTILSVVGAATILLSGLVPVVSAAEYSDGATGVVTVTSTGTFQPYICDDNVAFSNVTLTSQTVNSGRDATGTIVICYTDTIAYRGTFTTSLRSSNFQHVDGIGSISATNLTATAVHNPKQGQWSSQPAPIGCGPVDSGATNRPCIGDIGGWNGSSNVTSDTSTKKWTGGDFSTSKKVGWGYEGAGTANSGHGDTRLINGSYAEIDLKLTVPQNAPTGMYLSTLTIDVTLNAVP